MAVLGRAESVRMGGIVSLFGWDVQAGEIGGLVNIDGSGIAAADGIVSIAVINSTLTNIAVSARCGVPLRTQAPRSRRGSANR